MRIGILFTLLFAVAFDTPATAAYYAELDAHNVVLSTIVVLDADELDPNGQPSEAVGIVWCQKQYGGGNWIKTELEGGLRKHFAGPGMTWNQAIQAFIYPRPFPSWTLNADTANWIAPVPYPNDGKFYDWDEQNTAWVLSVEQ